jgi:hypothetical protein
MSTTLPKINYGKFTDVSPKKDSCDKPIFALGTRVKVNVGADPTDSTKSIYIDGSIEGYYTVPTDPAKPDKNAFCVYSVKLDSKNDTLGNGSTPPKMYVQSSL